MKHTKIVCVSDQKAVTRKTKRKEIQDARVWALTQVKCGWLSLWAEETKLQKDEEEEGGGSLCLGFLFCAVQDRKSSTHKAVTWSACGKIDGLA